MWAGIVELLSFDGRSNRAAYWTVVVGGNVALILGSFLVVAIATMIGGNAAGQGTGQLLHWIGIALALVVFACILFFISWIAVATAVRRLHDRDKSGWWAIPFLLIPAMLRTTVEVASRVGGVGFKSQLILDLIALVFVVWGFVELGVLAGTYGDNRFGRDPLGTTFLK